MEERRMGLDAARSKLGDLAADAGARRAVTILTSHGHPVARIVPLERDGHSLLGQQVRVTLDKADDGPRAEDDGDIPGDGPPHENVITEGLLLAFGDGGDFEILEDDGFVHYFWPMLKIEPRGGVRE